MKTKSAKPGTSRQEGPQAAQTNQAVSNDLKAEISRAFDNREIYTTQKFLDDLCAALSEYKHDGIDPEIIVTRVRVRKINEHKFILVLLPIGFEPEAQISRQEEKLS